MTEYSASTEYFQQPTMYTSVGLSDSHDLLIYLDVTKNKTSTH